MRLLFTIFFLAILSSCTTYQQSNILFTERIQASDYQKASTLLEKNKYLQKDKNRTLYLLEKGKVAFLDKQYQESLDYLNKADIAVEDFRTNIGAEALALITNDEARPFRTEEFEDILINYYKALSYIALGYNDEAIVEVRKLNIKLNAMKDKKVAKKYDADPFAMNLQGMLYEAVGDVNNAFIAYRNATEVYLDHDGTFYGTPIPSQLKLDVLRTADHLGFTNERLHFEKEFDMNYSRDEEADKYGVIIIETGLGPYKSQNYLTFAGANDDGVISYSNPDLGLNFIIPFDGDIDGSSGSLSVVNIAFPKYVPRGSAYHNITVQSPKGQKVEAEQANDITFLAKQNLKERMHREIGKMVIRQATKKLSEAAVSNGDENLGAALSVLNAFTEKADTRNWQTLPDKIYYIKVPLQDGDNQFHISLSNDSHQKNYTVNFNGTAKVQFTWINNLQSDPRLINQW